MNKLNEGETNGLKRHADAAASHGSPKIKVLRRLRRKRHQEKQAELPGINKRMQKSERTAADNADAQIEHPQEKRGKRSRGYGIVSNQSTDDGTPAIKRRKRNSSAIGNESNQSKWTDNVAAATKRRSKRIMAKKSNQRKSKRPRKPHFRPSPPEGPKKVLSWESRLDYVPFVSEKEMIDIVFFNRKERGTLGHQSDERIKRIKEKCKALGMAFHQASSLRSHHMLRVNRFSNAREAIGLGTEAVTRKAATIFEECVAAFLDEQQIPHMNEAEQKSVQPGGSTPDCLLRETVDLKWKNEEPCEINWVECKMFYGASTIPLDGKSAVGKLLMTASKYVDKFGPGAIVFCGGCGDQVAFKLKEVGVIALDADAVDLSRLDAYRELHGVPP
jgi:hypothetical protein